MNFGGEGRRSSTRRRVTSTVTIEKIHASNFTTIGNQGARARETVVGRVDRVPRCKVTPSLGDIERITKIVCGTVSWAWHERKGLCITIVVWVRRSSLDSSRLTE
jgi:hypothetical protein